MSGFLLRVAEAARRRRLRPGRPSRGALEDAAAEFAARRVPLLPLLRRPGGADAAEDPLTRPPRWIAALAAADPAAGTEAPGVDWPGWLEPARDAGVHAFLVRLEASAFLGAEAPLETLRARTDRPVIADDPLLEPGQVLELLARPVDAVVLDPALLDEGALHEAHALLRDFGAGALLVVRRFADVECAARMETAGVLIDRLDPDTLAPVPGLADRLLEALEGLPMLRALIGGITAPPAALAAARRAVDAVVLDPGWLWTREAREDLRGLPGMGADGASGAPAAFDG